MSIRLKVLSRVVMLLMCILKDFGCRMKNRLEGNKIGGIEINLEVVFVVFMKDDSDMILGYW